MVLEYDDLNSNVHDHKKLNIASSNFRFYANFWVYEQISVYHFNFIDDIEN